MDQPSNAKPRRHLVAYALGGLGFVMGAVALGVALTRPTSANVTASGEMLATPTASSTPHAATSPSPVATLTSPTPVTTAPSPSRSRNRVSATPSTQATRPATPKPTKTADATWAGPVYQAPSFVFKHTECTSTGDGGFRTSYWWEVTGIFYEVRWGLSDENGNQFEMQDTNRAVGYKGNSSHVVEGRQDVGLPDGPQTLQATLETTFRDPTTGRVMTASKPMQYSVVCQ